MTDHIVVPRVVISFTETEVFFDIRKKLSDHADSTKIYVIDRGHLLASLKCLLADENEE